VVWEARGGLLPGVKSDIFRSGPWVSDPLTNQPQLFRSHLVGHSFLRADRGLKLNSISSLVSLSGPIPCPHCTCGWKCDTKRNWPNWPVHACEDKFGFFNCIPGVVKGLASVWEKNEDGLGLDGQPRMVNASYGTGPRLRNRTLRVAGNIEL
jgi:hypothetical protein